MTPKAEYREFDERALDMLQRGALTVFKIAHALNQDGDVVRTILARLKAEGLLEWKHDNGAVRLKSGNATVDTSPFPRPSYKTPKVGWFG